MRRLTCKQCYCSCTHDDVLSWTRSSQHIPEVERHNSRCIQASTLALVVTCLPACTIDQAWSGTCRVSHTRFCAGTQGPDLPKATTGLRTGPVFDFQKSLAESTAANHKLIAESTAANQKLIADCYAANQKLIADSSAAVAQMFEGLSQTIRTFFEAQKPGPGEAGPAAAGLPGPPLPQEGGQKPAGSPEDQEDHAPAAAKSPPAGNDS